MDKSQATNKLLFVWSRVPTFKSLSCSTHVATHYNQVMLQIKDFIDD